MKLIFTAFFLTSYFFTFAQLSEINTGLNGIELAEEDYELYIEKHKINVTTTSLSEKQDFLGTIRRGQFITVLYKQTSNTQPGEFLGRLVLGEEDSLIKIFGATIY